MRCRTTVCILAAVMVAVPILGASAQQLEELFEKMDENFAESRFDENTELLEQAEDAAVSSSERAGYLWRLARNKLVLTDAKKRNGAPKEELLEGYKRCEELADEAVSLDSRNHNAYYWRASGVGRWGQTKGVLNSLMKAGPMREDLEKAVSIESDHADSYYVLGQLYAAVPKLISFGNIDYAVSYSRKALASYVGLQTKYSFYLKLAEQLWDRNWSERKRGNRFEDLEGDYREAETAVERNKYFEGVFDASASRVYARGGVDDLSDREEARKIVSWLIDAMESESRIPPRQMEYLETAQQLQKDWN